MQRAKCKIASHSDRQNLSLVTIPPSAIMCFAHFRFATLPLHKGGAVGRGLVSRRRFPFRSAKSANQMDSRGRLSLQLSYHTSPRQPRVSLPRAEQSIKSGSISPSPLHSPLFTFGEARSGNASAFLCFFREQQAAPLPNVTAPLHSSLFTLHSSLFTFPLGEGGPTP